MRPACRFYDGALLVEPVESRVSIGLQDSAKLSKVLYRMFRFAIRRIGEPHRRWFGTSGWAGRRERRSITDPFWFCRHQERAQERECHRRATFRHAAHTFAEVPLTVPMCVPRHRPNLPMSSAADPRLRVRRYPTAGIAANDRHISIPAHAPAALLRPCSARPDDSEQALAESDCIVCSCILDARYGSP